MCIYIYRYIYVYIYIYIYIYHAGANNALIITLRYYSRCCLFIIALTRKQANDANREA